MEQRSFSGKSLWYHETQSSQNLTDIQPLIPEAPQIDDPFLLDFTVSDHAFITGLPWLSAARTLSRILLPDQVQTNRLQTLSRYERLSTALTVAQVCGVQRLCHHYAARLAPESSSDSSRETNRRLTQITQFARQLASQPTSVNDSSLSQLDECGLSVADIVTFCQLIGFIGFQARVLAVLQALHPLPMRLLPGMTEQQDADTALFSQRTVIWQPGLTAPECRVTDAEQQILEYSHTSPRLSALADLLAWDTATLSPLAQLVSQFWPDIQHQSDDDHLVTMVVARINGSPACFSGAETFWQGAHALPDAIRNGERALHAWSHKYPRERAIIQATQLLTRAPQKFSHAQLSPIFEQGITAQYAVDLLIRAGLEGWLNRLKTGLGHIVEEPKTLSE